MKNNLAFKILRWCGWTVENDFPKGLKKSVVIVFHHTSNWDFPLGPLVRNAWGVYVQFIAKDSLFRFPFGRLFRWLGGYPVDRTKSNNFIQSVVEIFNTEPEFHVAISPEGTRKKVNKLKTGFYYIAVGAKVPIVCVKFDWGKKQLGCNEPIYPTGDYNADIRRIAAYYKGVTGKNPACDFDFDKYLAELE